VHKFRLDATEGFGELQNESLAHEGEGSLIIDIDLLHISLAQEFNQDNQKSKVINLVLPAQITIIFVKLYHGIVEGKVNSWNSRGGIGRHSLKSIGANQYRDFCSELGLLKTWF
jgi:hypothetical protein